MHFVAPYVAPLTPYLAPVAPYLTWANIGIALVLLNLLTFASFGIDKARSRDGGWRIREATLLQWALLGGTPGAYAGRALFRHKTRKQPFCSRLHAIAFLQVTALGLLTWWMLAA
ncbi:DUF1294 domain-containing protein [Novosphingobium tardum]|uniref:DUF1294 domain-containing protein n=1 Tax=Novosphingobium tardum TaxID=1538021 RepID=A0ABV8RN50_9SPHN